MLQKIDALNFTRYIPQILEIERASFRTPWTREMFRREVEIPVAQLWVLLNEEALCGYICFWLVADEIHLLNVAVAPVSRKRGTASVLIRRMLAYGRARGAHAVWLEVRPSNEAALSLYQKLGFIVAGCRRGYYQDTREDAILMRLEMTPDPPRACTEGREGLGDQDGTWPGGNQGGKK